MKTRLIHAGVAAACLLIIGCQKNDITWSEVWVLPRGVLPSHGTVSIQIRGQFDSDPTDEIREVFYGQLELDSHGPITLGMPAYSSLLVSVHNPWTGDWIEKRFDAKAIDFSRKKLIAYVVGAVEPGSDREFGEVNGIIFEVVDSDYQVF